MNTEYVHIKNFKSIKDLEFITRKINLFIGEPNSGKSNIIEALSFFSFNPLDQESLSKLMRFRTMSDLFFDADVTWGIHVSTDKTTFSLKYDRTQFLAELKEGSEKEINPILLHSAKIDLNGIATGARRTTDPIKFKFRTYIFKRLNSFLPNFTDYLDTPFGENIPGLLFGNSKYKNMVSSFLRAKGFKLQLKPVENDIAISKEVNDEIYSYPYQSMSETFQRVIFMMLAIESNKDSVLIFDEPEANTFPFYTKFIAEKIALDNNNQYFISTHNPYLLSAIVEKADKKDLGIFITYMDNNYQTQVKMLQEDQLSEVLDLSSDVFFNLEKFKE